MKQIVLKDKEIDLLLIALRCMDEENYNAFTWKSIPWNEAKELKDKLRAKLKSVLFNV